MFSLRKLFSLAMGCFNNCWWNSIVLLEPHILYLYVCYLYLHSTIQFSHLVLNNQFLPISCYIYCIAYFNLEKIEVSNTSHPKNNSCPLRAQWLLQYYFPHSISCSIACWHIPLDNNVLHRWRFYARLTYNTNIFWSVASCTVPIS